MAESGTEMPKLNVKRDMPKLSDAQLAYMKLIERQNVERVRKLAKMRSNNLKTVGALFLSVFGIYGYTIYATKQEHFLDEIE